MNTGAPYSFTLAKSQVLRLARNVPVRHCTLHVKFYIKQMAEECIRKRKTLRLHSYFSPCNIHTSEADVLRKGPPASAERKAEDAFLYAPKGASNEVQLLSFV